MQKIRKNISQEEYDKYFDAPYDVKAMKYESNISPEWTMGYGYYGFAMKQDENGCYVEYSIGDSCD